MIGPFLARRAGEGWEYGFLPEQRHLNIGGVVHGGMLMSFVDDVLGMTVWEAAGRKPVHHRAAQQPLHCAGQAGRVHHRPRRGAAGDAQRGLHPRHADPGRQGPDACRRGVEDPRQPGLRKARSGREEYSPPSPLIYFSGLALAARRVPTHRKQWWGSGRECFSLPDLHSKGGHKQCAPPSSSPPRARRSGGPIAAPSTTPRPRRWAAMSSPPRCSARASTRARSRTSSWAPPCSRAARAATSPGNARCAPGCRTASPACRSTGNAPPA